jgi:hypothetical protein
MRERRAQRARMRSHGERTVALDAQALLLDTAQTMGEHASRGRRGQHRQTLRKCFRQGECLDI